MEVKYFEQLTILDIYWLIPDLSLSNTTIVKKKPFCFMF